MKQKDIGIILLVAVISGVVSIVLSGILISPKKDQTQTAEVVDKITATFPTPNPKYFNKESNNPTKKITIGDTPNPIPFNQKN